MTLCDVTEAHYYSPHLVYGKKWAAAGIIWLRQVTRQSRPVRELSCAIAYISLKVRCDHEHPVKKSLDTGFFFSCLALLTQAATTPSFVCVADTISSQ